MFNSFNVGFWNMLLETTGVGFQETNTEGGFQETNVCGRSKNIRKKFCGDPRQNGGIGNGLAHIR